MFPLSEGDLGQSQFRVSNSIADSSWAESPRSSEKAGSTVSGTHPERNGPVQQRP